MRVAFEVVVFVITIVDLFEAVHVHLAHKRNGLLGMKLVVGRFEVMSLELVAIQIDSLAVG